MFVLCDILKSRLKFDDSRQSPETIVPNVMPSVAQSRAKVNHSSASSRSLASRACSFASLPPTTSVATTLIPEGRTAYPTLGFSLDSSSHTAASDKVAADLQHCSLLIVDEVSMLDSVADERVDV